MSSSASSQPTHPGELGHKSNNYQLSQSLLFTKLSSEKLVPLISAACEILIITDYDIISNEKPGFQIVSAVWW